MNTLTVQIDNEQRPATDDEVSNLEQMRQDASKAVAEFEARQKTRAAVIAKLGLTADEAAALLG